VLLFLASWTFQALAVRTSLQVASLLALIGVPIHEFSHAIGSLITLEGVDAVKPLIDELGFAFVVPKRPNLLGKIVSTIAPLFGGIVVLWLTAAYIIPGFELPAVTLPQLNSQDAPSLGTVLKESMNYMWSFLTSIFANLLVLQWKNWRTWIGLYIALSVGVSLAPSSTDLRIFFRALLLALFLSLPLFAWFYFSGNIAESYLTLQESFMPVLLHISTGIAYALLLTSLGVGVFSLLYIWKKIWER
jgi:hypothetical protein